MDFESLNSFQRFIMCVMVAVGMIFLPRSPILAVFLMTVLLLVAHAGSLDGLLSPISGPHRRRRFLKLLFELLGSLSKSDGAVTEAEIKRVERYMRSELRLSSREQQFAIEAFRCGKESRLSCKEQIERFGYAFQREPAVLHGALRIMQQLAGSDGEISPEEDRWLRFAQQAFGFTGTHARSWGRSYYDTEGEREHEQRPPPPPPPAEDDPYTLFGFKRGASYRELKRHYRKLAREYHPDNALARGLPRHYVEEANEKFKSLQKAWEQICREVGESSS
ncbi:MAG: DnaJ domain-containing protein [Deltaproteobacteria bacterium]|nr:DnaJ domain-containing protein [Deltaproteobacteria bacterium]